MVWRVRSFLLKHGSGSAYLHHNSELYESTCIVIYPKSCLISGMVLALWNTKLRFLRIECKGKILAYLTISFFIRTFHVHLGLAKENTLLQKPCKPSQEFPILLQETCDWKNNLPHYLLFSAHGKNQICRIVPFLNNAKSNLLRCPLPQEYGKVTFLAMSPTSTPSRRLNRFFALCAQVATTNSSSRDLDHFLQKCHF